MHRQKSKVRVAVCGVGFVGGQAHVPAFKKIAGSELVALNARTEVRVKKLAEKYNVRYYLDYAELLRSNVDAVVLSVPTPLHFQMASEAIALGKHVLCEMPLTPTIAESEKLGKMAEKRGVILMPVLNFRFTPNYVKAKELIETGAIGKPLAFSFEEFIAARSQQEQWPAGSWAWDISKSGGYPDFTLSVWSIDLIRWLFKSEIAEAGWQSNYSPLKELGDYVGYNTLGTMKLSNGTVGSLHYGSTVAPTEGTSKLEVFGDNTKIMRATWNNSLTLIGEEPPQKQEWIFTEGGTRVWGHYQMDQHFIECILHGKKPLATFKDAIKAQAVAAKMVKT
jgi:predicted dehydrogenase